MVDLLLIVLLGGAGVLGWQRGLAASLVAGAAFVLVGLPVAAVSAAIGSPPPVVGFLLGGMVGLVPVALHVDRLSQLLDDALDGRARVVDRLGGLVVNLAVVLVLGWFIAAVATIVPGDSGPLASIRGSGALGAVIEQVPPQGTLGAVVLRSGLVPGLNGPLVLAEPPAESSATLPAIQAARASVLQVRGTACDKIVLGTAWVAGEGLLLTNAHVVAGTRATFLAGGPRFEGLRATVSAFDPLNDIAVLAFDGQLPPPLPIVARVRHGEQGAVIGFPQGGERKVVPMRIDRAASYDTEPVDGGPARPAEVLAFRADVEPGNSGGPILAEDGTVLGMVVAKGLGQRVEAAYGVGSDLLLRALAVGAARRPVATGPCISHDEAAPGREPLHPEGQQAATIPPQWGSTAQGAP